MGSRRHSAQPAQEGGHRGAAVLGVSALLSPLDALASATASQKGAYSRSGAKSIRRRSSPTANDVRIGNHALTLEYLETAFHAAAVKANVPDADIAGAAKNLAAHEQALSFAKTIKTVSALDLVKGDLQP